MTKLAPLIIAQSENKEHFFYTFSQELASVDTKKHLSRLINKKIKSFLGFTDSTIFVLSDDGKVYTNFLFDSDIEGYTGRFPETIQFSLLETCFDINPTAEKNFDQPHPDYKNIVHIKAVNCFRKPNKDDEALPGVAINLYTGAVFIGSWIIFYGKDFKLHEDKYLPILELSNFITAAVLKLKAYKETFDSQNESEIIQSLNIDFASIRNKKDLLKIIRFKLKDLFDFGHHFVGAINDDELTMSTFLQDTDSRTKYHPKYEEVTYAKFPISDTIFNKVLLTKDPVIFDLNQLSNRSRLPEYLHINFESGIRKVVMIGLHVGNKIIGIWAICLIEKQELSLKQLNWFKSISNQLSVAVDNIRVNDEIRSKELEYETLLQLSYDITNIRYKKDLFSIVNRNLKKLFRYHTIVIMGLNHDHSRHTFLFSSDSASPDYSETEILTMEQRLHYDSYYDKVIETDGIVIFDLEHICKKETVSNYIKAEYENGIKEKVGIALRKNNSNIGVLYVNSLVKGDYTDHELELIKGVSYQISSAVCNILAKEEIILRERENELLLSMNTDIAAVRNHSELLSVITMKLKNHLGFSHMIIANVSDDQKNISAFLIDPVSLSRNHPVYYNVVNGSHPIDDGIFNEVLSSSMPVIFDFEQLKKSRTLPIYFQVNYESGIKQVVMMRLMKGTDILGLWMICYVKNELIMQSRLNLIAGFANQISIAVSNIKANDEIQLREVEKSKLLAFSNAIASVREKSLLSKILQKQLHDLFSIESYIIHAISDDQQKYIPLLYDPEAAYTNNPKFCQKLNIWTDIADSVLNTPLEAESPIFFDLESWNNDAQPSTVIKPGGSMDKETLVGVSIRLGAQNIAVMHFKHHDFDEIKKKQSLIKSICSQLAITISNILANEKVNNQLFEINEYKQQLEEEKVYLKEEIETKYNYDEIIGQSPEIQKTFRLVAQVAPSDSTVLILGETGTGKELIARAIHNNSPRKSKLMIKVNCAALPANLIESELFGHERGSFTGATEKRLGKFELADKGTLFLDEIGEMPLDLQVKLLRALQEKEIERIGGKNTIKVDVRIIAATNRDLDKEIAEGRFRTDLYYRLNIFPIQLSPLRERKQDIPLLAFYFIHRFSKKAGRNIHTLSNRAMEEMLQYSWPGNIRELEHLIERSVLLSTGEIIKQVHIPSPKQSLKNGFTYQEDVLKTLDELEKSHILKALKQCNGKIAGDFGAAKVLGIPPSTLNSKLKRFGIKKEHSA